MLILFVIIGMSLILSGMYLDTLYYHYLKESIARASAFREEIWFARQLSLYGALIWLFLAFAFLYMKFGEGNPWWWEK